MAQDKGKRVYQLAKELGVESKELLDFCKELGYDIKNQLSALTGDQAAAVLGMSASSADRHWVYTRAWLRRELGFGVEP